MSNQLLAKATDFITLFLGLLVEAIPFIFIGVVVSVAIALFINSEKVFALLPKNTYVRRFFLSIMGMFMPVCECGNVPVVRRLVMKGFSVSEAITFMLAAPVVNPVTFWTTWEAFSGSHEMAWARLIAAVVIANGVGIIFSFVTKQETLLTKKFYAQVCEIRYNDHYYHNPQSKWEEAKSIFSSEFIQNTKMLALGAIIAAAFQVIVPREWVLAISGNILLSIVAMTILAFVISICSNVDAFFALSYASSFPLGALLSFLVFGPMIDIKLLMMLKNTFTIKTLGLIVVLVALSSTVAGLTFHILWQ